MSTPTTRLGLSKPTGNEVLNRTAYSAVLDEIDAAAAKNDAALSKFKTGTGTYTDNDTSQTFNDAFCTALSLVVISITGSTPAGIWSVVSGAGSFTITSTASESTDITFDYYIIKVV